MGWQIRNNIDKGHFRLSKDKLYNYTINDILIEYNIDINDYYILKLSNKFKFIDFNDIEKYVGAVFLNKRFFNKTDIESWITFIYDDIKIYPQFIHTGFPPEYMIEKIKVVEWGGV